MAKHRLHCSEDWHVRDMQEFKVSRLGSEPYKLSQELLEGCGVGQGLGSQSQHRLSKKATCHGGKKNARGAHPERDSPTAYTVDRLARQLGACTTN